MNPDFFQDMPAAPDLYAVDRALHAELRRRLSADVAAVMGPRLEAVGRATAGELPTLADEAERDAPRLVPYDPWGRRVDDIRVSPAWMALKDFAARHAIVATGYEAALGGQARIAQAALIHLFSGTTATAACPLAMTDAAARVLLDLAPPPLRDRLVPRLLSRDPKTFITSGQWMTERTGGSDVSQTSTVARLRERATPEGDVFGLWGVKWFTSATTSEMSLALARIEEGGDVVLGGKGLTLFCVDVERDDIGALKGIRVNRMKDKLGTKALPTAELTLEGVRGVRLGDVGRGVASISGMLNITRFYNACAASSGMARAAALARAYSWKRTAFGKPLAAHPLHATTLDDMDAEAAGALAMCMELAALLGRAEHGVATEEERRRMRALIPIAKLTTGKQAVAVASEALEAFGGAGYVEDTGLPRLLRDAQVLPIWEGTTNVLSMDVLRAEGKEGAFSTLLQDLTRRVEGLDATLPQTATRTLQSFIQALTARITELVAVGPNAVEENARRIAWTTGLCVEALLLAETAVATGKDDAVARFGAFTRHRLAGPLG